MTVEAGADEDDEIHLHAGGQGFWIARLLGRLGVPTHLITVLGGESGQVTRALIEQENITVRAVSAASANGAWIHDRRSGERLSVAEDGGDPLDRHVVDELLGATLAAALACGICVLAGPHRPTHIGSEPYRRMAQDLRSNGVTVIADLSGDHLLAALDSGVDFCKTSEEDLVATTAIDGATPLEMIQQLRRLGADNGAVTMGGAPLIAFIDGDFQEVSAPRFQEVDHRGAGDAFTALVAAARYWGLSWSEAVCWGAAAGALTVARRGLATADRREIHQIVPRVHVTPLH